METNMNIASPRLKLAFAFVLAGAASPAALAQSANVTVENLSVPGKDKGTLLYKRIDVVGTNLTKDEVAKLFSGASKDESAALAKKLKAEKISIAEALLTGPDSSVAMRDFLATGVSDGRIASATLKSVEGKGKSKGGDVAFKSGAIEMQGLVFTSMLAAAASGDIGEMAPQVGKLNWTGFEATVPDESTKPTAPGGNLFKISLGSLTAEGTYDGEVPVKGRAEAKSLIVEPPKGSEMGKALASFGYDKINLGFVASGDYDKGKKTYNLDNFTVSGVNAGSLAIKLLLGGVDPSIFSAKKDVKMAGFMGADISSLSLRFDNNGLFDKAVDYFAKQQKKQPAAVKQEWGGFVQIIPVMLGGDPAGAKIADAAGRFIATPKSFSISLKAKGAPLKFMDLMSIRDPQALLKRVDVDAAAGQ